QPRRCGDAGGIGGAQRAPRSAKENQARGTAMDFTPPTTDQVLASRVSAGIDESAAHERFEAARPDSVEAIVEGIGASAAGEWAPLNRSGDTEGAKWNDGTVTSPAGFADAYRAFVEQGWNAIAGPVDHGGQGSPFASAT
ncbi:hypothetical protein OY671_011058, partial [Metschnikowia pulcherrima]